MIANNSPKYKLFFKLGINRELSKCELSSLFKRLNAQHLKYEQYKDYLFVDYSLENLPKLSSLLSQTGSIIKAGFFTHEISLKTIQSSQFSSLLEHWLENKIFTQFKSQNHKIKVGFNFHFSSKDIFQIFHSKLLQLLSNIMKARSFQFKLVPSNKMYFDLPPYQYHKQKIHSRGIELTIFQVKSKILLGYTRWVTNPLEDMKLDEKRPIRYFTHGTSIKVARTLIFLSDLPQNGLLLDPFCGTGTILLQGLKLGYRVIGVDKDPKCVRAAKMNLQAFVRQSKSFALQNEKWQVFLHDSRSLKKVIKEPVDAIVTEPFLGPFLKRLPPIDEAKGIMQQLTELYIRVLKQSSQVIKKGRKIIFIMPIYSYAREREISPDHMKIADKANLKLITTSELFDVSLPIPLGRKHNIIRRKLVVFTNE
ncbi:MAG: TRM11 family SAM-dependent methyltransferase [Candidatus Heimdallarchaeaceae archaeon]